MTATGSLGRHYRGSSRRLHQHGYMPETKDQWESVARKADICADHMIYNREEK